MKNPYFYGYLVEKDGFLELPSFGRIKAEGFSLRELENIIKQIALSYFEDPVVRLNIINFDITVLGEVNNPGTYNIQDPQVNILRVLSLAGDMTQYGNRKKVKIIRAIPLPPISLKKGPVPICPPNKKVKDFFNKIGTTIEIKNEKLSINFWATSGMMASFYELLRVMSNWLVKKGIKRDNAQKYITSLFLALSEDAAVNAKNDLKYLVKESQTPKGLNEQGVRELTKLAFYRKVEKTLNSIHKRLEQ